MRSTAFLKYYRSVRVVAVGAQRQAEAGLKERFERLAAELELERQRSNRSRNTCRLHSACHNIACCAVISSSPPPPSLSRSFPLSSIGQA